MALKTKAKTWADTEVLYSADINQNFDDIYNEFNGSIGADNIADAAITTTKIADANVTPGKFSATAWTDYSTTVTLTGFTKGNGTLSCSYIQIGKIVLYRGSFTFGSTSAKTGNFSVSMPVVAKTGSIPIGTVYGNNAGTAYYTGVMKSGSFFSDGSTSQWSNTLPFTWGTGDNFSWTVIYEAN
jgi:hypothetical protein